MKERAVKYKYIIVSIFITLITLIGGTFAYFTAKAGSGEDAIATAGAEVTLKYTDDLSNVKTKLIPSAESIATNKAKEIENKCIDANGYEVCSLYTFTVQNTGNIIQDIEVSMIPSENTFENLKYKVYRGDGNNISDTNLLIEGTKLSLNDISGISLDNLNTSIEPNDEVTYTIMFWVDEIGEDQTKTDSGKEYNATIVINGLVNGTVAPYREVYGDATEWEYTVNNEGENTITLNKYIGTKTELVVPNKLEVNGTTYTVTNLEASDVTYTLINAYGFYNAKGSNITGGDSNTAITSVSISDGVDVGGMAFNGFTVLTSVTFGNYIENIKSKAFQGCTSLTGEVKIPEGVKFLGLQAFSDDTEIDSVTIPSTITRMDGNTFWGCNLEELNYNAISPEVYNFNASSNSGAFVFSNGTISSIKLGNLVKIIPSKFFYGSYITNIKFNSNLREIRDYSFNSIDELVTVDFSEADELAVIGDSAFAYTGITNLDFTNNRKLNIIGDAAFLNKSDITQLTSVTFGEDSHLTYIYKNAFRGNEKLTTFEFEKLIRLKEIGDYAFNTTPTLTGVDFSNSNSLETIGNYAFADSGLSGTVSFPSKLKTIGDYAFYNISALTGIDFSNSDSLETIGTSSFNVTGLNTSITFPKSLKYISKYSFAGTNIKNIVFNEGLLWIGDYAFNHCSSVTNTKIVIPSTVKQIGGDKYVGSNDVLGSHIFYDFAQNTLEEYEVTSGNSNYMTVDGVLYSKSDSKPKYLVAYPSQKKDTTFNMPNSVVGMHELSFNRNKYATTINLSDSFVVTNDLPDNFNEINAAESHNLAIGIYKYNNVANITVNSTNKNYKSVNGILLSKDGKELIFIPLANSGTGTITIPEGVESTIKGAIYPSGGHHYTATKIVIPSTLTSIDEQSLKTLNSGVTNSKWTIELSSENTAYELDTNGKIVAQ